MKKALQLFLCSTLICQSSLAAESISDAITGGKANADFNLRYETVEQDNALKDAKALTLRSRIGYTTGTFKNFSAMIEMEDSRIVGGVDEFSVGPTGYKPGEYSVIADPEHTEVDQGFIKYNTSQLTTKLGRQVLTYDGQRFIGHVGWRQDRQTFDALRVDYSASEALKLSYSYLWKRNRIFAEAADVDSKDSLINVSFKTGVGTLTGYGYLLEVDDDTDNALDTFGFSFKGAAGKVKYLVEIASQSAESGSADADADYMHLQGSMGFGVVSATLGYEVLGSDDANYGFSTPLATLHKYNGWSDQFLSTPDQGLVDLYISVSAKLAGGKFVVAFHDFSADEDTSAVDDMGDELDILYVKKYGKHYVTGIKYASYSAGDIKVDTDKLWLWAGLKF